MKYILLTLLLPLFASAQTVHIKDDKIDYEETVSVKSGSKSALYNSAKAALMHSINSDGKAIITDAKKNDKIAACGSIKLSPDGVTVNKLLFTIEMKIKKDGYKYHIHKVHVVQYKSGVKISDISSEDLLEGMDSSGDTAAKTEKQLNEIDMDFQKIIALIKADMNGSK